MNYFLQLFDWSLYTLPASLSQTNIETDSHANDPASTTYDSGAPTWVGEDYTYNGGAGTQIVINDDDPEFQDAYVETGGIQTLAQDVTIDGTLYTAGSQVQNEFSMVDASGNEVWILRIGGTNVGLVYRSGEEPNAGQTFSAANGRDGDPTESGDGASSNEPYTALDTRDGTVTGSFGDDTINVSYSGDPEDDRIDDGWAGGTGTNDNTVFALGGNDSVEAGLGNDTIYGGGGNDRLDGQDGADRLLGEDGSDTLEGGSGSDSLVGGAGSDSLSGGTGDDTLLGGDGNDTLIAGNNTGLGDLLVGGAGDDELTDSFWNATLEGGDGADLFNVGFGEATITGGEGGTDNDTLSFADANDTADIVLSGNESGTYTDDDGDGGTFSEIEAFTLTSGNDSFNGTASSQSAQVEGGAGDDSIVGTSGDDTLEGGEGADTLAGGGGNDSIDVGAGDGVVDTVVFSDGDGADTVSGFEAPVDAGGGVFTGRDQVDVSNLTDTNGLAVTVADVTVTDDGFGNAFLSFPNGESITLVGIAPGDVSDDDALAAMGIAADDYIIEGSSGADTIDAAYLGDPDGDRVDASDNAEGDNDDSIVAGAGNDSIAPGEGRDTVEGGDGNDTIDAGVDDSGTGDVFDGGADTDTVDYSDLTGAVNVDLSAGTGSGGAAEGDSYSNIENVIGSAGADTITGDGFDNDLDTGDGADTVLAGAGNDSIDGGQGNDTIFGQDGDDTILGGDGDDSLDGDDGADGDDSLDGGAGNDTLIGDGGNDTLLGGDGDDDIFASGGDNLIDGGDGADEVFGGTGNDSITVDQGDTVVGGDGDDVFSLQDLDTTGTGNADIDITGGEGGETNGDTLILTPDVSYADIVFEPDADNAGGFSGRFQMADGTDVTFREIENIICFTPGTRILTGHGERPIETLTVGDLVVTRDQGLRPIRWIGHRTVRGRGKFAPVRIGANALDTDRGGLLVSPQHRILFTGYRAELLFGDSEVLVPAKHLIDGRDVVQETCEEVTYFHMMFDHHEVIYAEGIATESFHAGDMGLSAVSEPAREELFGIFPELRSAPGNHLETARLCLKKHEAQLLVDSAGSKETFY